MEEFELGNEYKVLGGNSSGTQNKFYKDGKWFKLNTAGREDMAEYLASVVLSCSNVPSYVTYVRCKVNSRSACYSQSFISDGDCTLSFDKIYSSYVHRSLSDYLFAISDCVDRYKFLYSTIQSITGIDIRLYLRHVFAIDLLLLNIDRHFNNLTVLIKNSGQYASAPVFDNGQALGANYNIFPPYMSVGEVIEKSTSCTISGSFVQQFKVAGNSLMLDYKSLYSKLSMVPDCREKQILCTQLNTYRNIFERRV